MINLDTEYLQKMVYNTISSRTLEIFFIDCKCKIDKKMEVTNKLKGSLVDIARSKCGSHVLDACFQCSNLQKKRNDSA